MNDVNYSRTLWNLIGSIYESTIDGDGVTISSKDNWYFMTIYVDGNRLGLKILKKYSLLNDVKYEVEIYHTQNNDLFRLRQLSDETKRKIIDSNVIPILRDIKLKQLIS